MGERWFHGRRRQAEDFIIKGQQTFAELPTAALANEETKIILAIKVAFSMPRDKNSHKLISRVPSLDFRWTAVTCRTLLRPQL